MSARKGRPGMGGLRDPRGTDRLQFNGRPIERPETIEQAKRWDVQKSRAIAHGLCEKCAGQYSWGLQIGFTHSRPPCPDCAVIITTTVGEIRPNGWRNMRLTDVGTGDTRERSHAHMRRPLLPELLWPMSANGSTSRRGYGWRHQQARARAKRYIDAGQAVCVRCGGWVDPRTRWHLDHTDDRSGYLGISHGACNVNAARRKRGTRGAAKALAFFNPPS